MRFGFKNTVLALASFAAVHTAHAQQDSAAVKKGASPTQIKDLNVAIKKQPSFYYKPDSTAFHLFGGKKRASIAAEFVNKEDGLHIVQTTNYSSERDNRVEVTGTETMDFPYIINGAYSDRNAEPSITLEYSQVQNAMDNSVGVGAYAQKNTLRDVKLSYKRNTKGVFATSAMDQTTLPAQGMFIYEGPDAKRIFNIARVQMIMAAITRDGTKSKPDFSDVDSEIRQIGGGNYNPRPR